MHMKKFCFLLILFWTNHLFAQQQPEWMRYPAISPDGNTIAFTYKGDIFKVSASGGEAIALITNAAHDFMPVWSHDGEYIAFASNRYGNFDIFIVPASGGQSTRLTYNSTDEYPYSFSPDNQFVLFGAAKIDAPFNRQFPSESLPELYKVPVSGGRTVQLLTTPAEDAKMSKDGRYIIYHDRKGRENPWRKHQVSSIARDVWIYDIESASHKKLSAFAGENRSPVFSADDKEIFYLSEKSGDFNVFKMSLKDTASSQQLTFFKNNPVRFLSIAADNTLCFGYDGHIFIKKKNEKPVEVKIKISGEQERIDEKIISVNKAKEIAISPNGKEVAFIFRGEVFVSSVEGHDVKQITYTPEAETGISFSPDGKKLLYASERNKSWKIYEAEIVNKGEPYFFASSLIREKPLIANDKENYQPAYSPDGKEVAFIENRATLKVFNIASGKSRNILDNNQLLSRRDNDQYFQWSPDNRWLLVQFNEQGGGNSEVGIVSSSGKGPLINLTQNGYSDENPKWMMNGKMIMWSSDRLGLRNENSNTSQSDIFGMFTDENAWANFKLSQSGTSSAAKKDTLNEWPQKGENKSGLEDWNHLRNRKVRLTGHSSFLMDALISKDGKYLYFLDKFEKNYDLWFTDLRSGETKKIVPLNVDEAEMKWGKDQENIFLLADGDIFKINLVTLGIDTINFEIKLKVDLAKERQGMFEHVWRRTAETFYTSGMHGTDWNYLKRNYQKYLSGIDNNFDFTEMLNELLGELNISHTGATFKDERKDGDATASLGIFYDDDYKGLGVKIKEIIQDGPLDNSLFGIKAGDIIDAVDGEVILKDKDIDQYLNLKSGKKTLLKINNGISLREITVSPVSAATEEDLLYKRWVNRNEEETNRLSNGKFGYVHLYRMNDGAYRSTYADAMGKFAKCKAIIVDTRFNRGGDLAPELTMFLSGVKVRENTSDRFIRSNEPSFRWTRPSIVLANEANYSDGHCFAYDYQYLQMGKLIGMPIPGSCTWMTGQPLQDNTMYYSVPTLGVKTVSGRYLENYQTEPDILVANEYGAVSVGKDQQLEAAIKELKNEIKRAK